MAVRGVSEGVMGRRALVGGLALLAAATAPALAEEGSFFGNLFKYGGTTVPPSQPKDIGEAYCPAVDVADGGASVQSFGGKAGDGAALRSQITLGRLARECALSADGAVTVRVGVQGRVLLGPAGAPGRFEAPVQIAIKRGGAIIASRARRGVVTLAKGEMGGDFSLVEEGLVVPPAMAQDYAIEVRLGSAPKATAARKQKAPQTSESFAPGTGAPAKE